MIKEPFPGKTGRYRWMLKVRNKTCHIASKPRACYLQPQVLLQPLRLAPLMVLLVVLAGCGDARREPLVGTWRLDDTSHLANRIGQRVTQPGSDELSEGNGMTIQFLNNGTLKTETRMGSIERAKSGTWEVLEWEADRGRMKVRCVLEGQETEHQIELLDDGRIRLTPPNMAGTRTKLVFRRTN